MSELGPHRIMDLMATCVPERRRMPWYIMELLVTVRQTLWSISQLRLRLYRSARDRRDSSPFVATQCFFSPQSAQREAAIRGFLVHIVTGGMMFKYIEVDQVPRTISVGKDLPLTMRLSLTVILLILTRCPPL